MWKKVAAAVTVLMCLVVLTACGRKSYAGVQLSDKKYERVQTSNKNIEALVTALQKFRYDDDKSAQRVYNAADKLNKSLQPGLSTNQRHHLDVALGSGTTGVKGIVQNAASKEYDFDDEVASQFHANFRIVFDLAAFPIGHSEQQRNKVETQMRKDTNADTELYKIGGQD
ncbi:hypothetical protein ACRYI5_01895 [Furfurilactobacillus sp. WILCCON 0119]|uniref:hypothetical protein n=1 Tax=Furfurilactobacillus entadae TaxID=2922307 RepID=UPI0035E9F33A